MNYYSLINLNIFIFLCCSYFQAYCMQNCIKRDEQVEIVYPSGKKRNLPKDLILESKILKNYLKFLANPENDYKPELDLSGIQFFNDRIISEENKLIADISFDNFFNLLGSFKNYTSSQDFQMQSISKNLINNKLSLEVRLDIINLAEFLAVDKLTKPCAVGLSYLFSQYIYLKNIRYDKKLFNKILYMQTPYIKRLAGIALMGVESCQKSKIGFLLDQLISKKFLGEYKYAPKIASLHNNLLFLYDNTNNINMFKLNNDKLELLKRINLPNKIHTVAFNSEHNLMVVSFKNKFIGFFKKENNRFIKIFKKKFKAFSQVINALKISNDNKYLAAVSDSYLYIINLKEGVIIAKFGLDESLDFNIKSRYHNKKNKNNRSYIKKFCPFVDFIRDNQIMAVTTSGKIIFIDTEDNNDINFIDIGTNIVDKSDFITIEAEKCALHPSKNILAVYCKDNKVCLYDINKKSIIYIFDSNQKVMSLQFSPDNTEFSYVIGQYTNGGLFLFDIYTKDMILNFRIKTKFINSFTCFNNGSDLLVTLSNGSVKKIELKTLRNFILKNEYLFEHMLLLLSIFNKEKFSLNSEKDYIVDLFNCLPERLKKSINKNFS